MIGAEKVLTLTGWLWQLFDVYESSLSSNIWNKEEYKEAMALLRYFFSCLQWHPYVEKKIFVVLFAGYIGGLGFFIMPIT